MATALNWGVALLSVVQVWSKVCGKNAARAVSWMYVQQTRCCLFLVVKAAPAHVNLARCSVMGMLRGVCDLCSNYMHSGVHHCVICQRSSFAVFFFFCRAGAVHSHEGPVHEKWPRLRSGLLHHSTVHLQWPPGPERTDSTSKRHWGRKYKLVSGL